MTPAKNSGPTVEDIVDEFVDRLQTGGDPDIYDYLIAHPHLALTLEPRLEAVLRMHKLALSPADETPVNGGDYTTVTPHPSTNGSLPIQIDRYRIQGVLGRGSSAIVYRARDEKLARDVALKVIHPEQAVAQEAAERFLRDARIAAQLRHPHIVHLHETGNEGSLHYIDMQLIAGECLEARLRRGPVEPRQAAEWVHKVAAALHYAHQAGIVHRDIKPSNILIDAQGEPQLTDFGLARRLTGETSLTAHGQILGTPAYMSPEQASGNAHEADARSDVYSLGVVFYRLLTGKLPFHGEDPFALLKQIAETPPPAPTQIQNGVPRDLETICLKAMEKEANHRFASAGAFADELWRWLHAETLTIRPPGCWEKVRRWSRRNQAIAWTILSAAAALLIFSTVLGMAAWQERVKRIVHAESEAELKCWAILDQARERLRKPTHGRRDETQEILRAIKEPRNQVPRGKVVDRIDLELRSLFASTLSVPELVVLQEARLPSNWAMPWRAAIHPGGESMVIGTNVGPVHWRLGKQLILPPGLDEKKPRARVAYSPDGRYVVFAPEIGGLQIYNETATAVIVELEKMGNSPPVLAVGFNEQAKTLLTCRADGRINSWSLENFQPAGGPEIFLRPQAANQRSPSPVRFTAAGFNKGGADIAVGDAIGRVWLARVNGMVTRTLPSVLTQVESLAWSPDDTFVGVGSRDGMARLFTAKDGALWHAFGGFSDEITSLQFSPDGRWVLAACRGDAFKMIQVADREPFLGGEKWTVWGFSQDGKYVAATNHQRASAFCRIEEPTVIRRLNGHLGPVAKLAWSRDNRHLVSLDSTFEVRVWEIGHPEAIDSFRLPPGDYFASNAAVALSDDAQQVACANGGENPVFLIHDVGRHKEAFRYALPEGYEQLACKEGRIFISVREEIEKPGKEILHSVAREFTAEKLIKRWQVRSSMPEDVRRFHLSSLTPDGRYLSWLGPRQPSQKRRVEIWDVYRAQSVLRIPRPGNATEDGLTVTLSPDGRYLQVQDDGTSSLIDLHGGDEPRAFAGIDLYTVAPDLTWTLGSGRTDDGRSMSSSVLRSGLSADPWWVNNESLFPFISTGDHPASHDSRYLALGCVDGGIELIDIPKLKAQATTFMDNIQRTP